MSDLINPSLERLHTIQDALFMGMGDQITTEGNIGGELMGYFKSAEDNTDNFSELQIIDLRNGARTAICFAPSNEDTNPMYVTETDNDISIKVPILARMVVVHPRPVSLYEHDGVTIDSRMFIFNFTEDKSILSVEKEFKVPALVGSFDSTIFRFIDGVSSKVSSVERLAELALQYI